MQFHAEAATAKKGQPGYLRDGDPDDEGNPTVMTRLVRHEGPGCIFLNRPGFEGGAGCALHIAADDSRRTNDGLEAAGVLASPAAARTFQRRVRSCHVTTARVETPRLGNRGRRLRWWCTEEPEAFVGSEPLYRSARDEIVELIGAPIYDQMVQLLERTAGCRWRIPS